MEEAQIAVDVETSPLSESMQCKLKLQKRKMQPKLDKLWGNPNEAKNFTIFRTPHNISQTKKNLFEPSVISIGPYHRGQKHLQALEEQKWRFLQDFLSREEHISLDLCISEMNSLEERARRCYSETFDDLDSDTFVEMMLLDGCFVLEYFLKKIEQKSNPIFEVGWNSNFILRDLLLLDNQIPFFIVKKLYDIGLKKEIIKNFVRPLVHNVAHLLVNVFMIADQPPSEIHHLVHLCYYYLVPDPVEPVVLSSKSFVLNRIIKVLTHWFCSRVLKRRSPHSTSESSSMTLLNSTGNISSMVIPSATNLKRKGLKFTLKSDPNHMLDISFEYGVLKIPRLAITYSTKPIFANLLAFEQSKYGKEHLPFTSFLILLGNLVNTENDVRILQECRIIENWLGTEEHVAHFLNNVIEGTVFDGNHYLAQLFTEVNRYIESRWNRHIAKLIRDYFSSPWAIMSVFAAFIFLVLTFVQSFFTIYAYKVPPKP